MAVTKETHDDRFNTFNFTSSFDRARLIFQEIESILESELADTPQIVANYEQNISKVKSKRKRGGPFLIKPLNKSKARKTLNDMEFDPVLGVWVGNDEVMKTFAAHKPALIINRNRIDKPKKEGNMIWDAKEHKWRGNEEDLRVFGPTKIPLISNRVKSDMYTKKEINGMSFDPVNMRWVGNEVDLLDFGTISEQLTDDGFVVGTEFQLSPATIQLFTDCANRHKATTTGWWQENDKSRTHLHIIRTMSIMRVVRDVKRSAFAFYEEPADMDIAHETKEQPNGFLKSPRAAEETDLDDASWDDVGEFSGSGPLKIKLPEDSSVDIDFDLDKEPGKDEKKALNRTGTKLHLVDEDWDNDFEDDSDKLQNKITQLKTNTLPLQGNGTAPNADTSMNFSNLITKLNKGGSISEKKPFALTKADAPTRRSFILPTDTAKKLKQASDDDDEQGLEIPAEPLRLKLNRVPPASSADEDLDLDGEEPQPADSISNPEEPYEEEEEEEVEEEDWNDVELPTALGEPVTKRPDHLTKLNQQPPAPEREEWDDMEIPSEKLANKIAQQKLAEQVSTPAQATQKPNKSKDEDSWDDLDIPDNFQLRLKRK